MGGPEEHKDPVAPQGPVCAGAEASGLGGNEDSGHKVSWWCQVMEVTCG